MDEKGVWIAYYHDWSAFFVFKEEIDALRLAVANNMQCGFLNFGGRLAPHDRPPERDNKKDGEEADENGFVWSTCEVCGGPIFRHYEWSHQGGTPPQGHLAAPIDEGEVI